MPTLRAQLALSTSLLGLAAFACTNDNDPLGINQDSTGDDGSGDGEATGDDDGADETGPGDGNCGPDPECTTSAACGNGELCSECMCVPIPSECGDSNECLEDSDCGPSEFCFDCACVHPCTMVDGASCLADDVCDSGVCDPRSCMCAEPGACTAADACQTDDDCTGSATCDLESCTCSEDCECGVEAETCREGTVCDGCNCNPLNGTLDPADDCDADGTPAECAPSLDLLATDVACDNGTITAVAQFDAPVEPTPATPARRILECLGDDGFLKLRMYASAPGDGAPYECSLIIPGVMMADLGAADVCEIAADGSFSFALSPESAMMALDPITSVFARSEASDPYYYDDGEPIPVVCE
ncbi:MAG: hypothetical protein AAF721_03980 [Myxococcota bacterium]